MPDVIGNVNNDSNGNCENNNSKNLGRGLLDTYQNPKIIWDKKVPNTELEKFQKLIEKKYGQRFASYWDLHKWSVENYTSFWKEVWHFFGVICSRRFEKVFAKTGPGLLDNGWFIGARFNYAENILRCRDDRVALMYIDELGNEDTVSFSEMFEEVKLYAAAFRKNGLKMGDTVACYMSHRKEAIFAMLAAVSIGAIFGGPPAFYGGKYASNIVNLMDAKFLITIDYHQDWGIPENMLEYIPIVADSCPTVEKVILLVTQSETYKKDISNIRDCVLLEEFLNSGRNPDGTVPDIIFEQLPFSHPISINFTSGTTGLPKAPVHCAGVLISHFKDFSIHWNLKSGDTVSATLSVGWCVWDYFIPTLALGLKYLLYCSSVFFLHNGKNYWDMMAKYNVNFTFLANSFVEHMEKMDMKPSPGTDLDCLKMIAIGGSPVKKESFEYLRNRVKKDLFVGSMYGATETIGTFSGYNLNMPAYAGEIQTFALGMDVKCFDETGNSVIGEKGELVVCTPAPIFPIKLWKDENKTILNETYLSKYSGVWCQNDQCWINPKTKGLVVIGRSDDTLKQKDVRFSAGEVYFAIHSMKELEDYICVPQLRDNGDTRAVLFVKMRKGYKLTNEIKTKIGDIITAELMDECIPECIVEVPDIPYNENSKRLESVVKKIIATNTIPNVRNAKNAECLKYFLNIPEVMSYYEQCT